MCYLIFCFNFDAVYLKELSYLTSNLVKQVQKLK